MLFNITIKKPLLKPEKVIKKGLFYLTGRVKLYRFYYKLSKKI
jgi:hypothetical protein